MSPSPQQQTAIDFTTKNGSGNCLVKAVAGSGKTSTGIQMLLGFTGNVAFCAFSSDIAKDIQKKVDKVADQLSCRVFVGTTHSFGRKALIKAFPKSKLATSKTPLGPKVDILMNEIPHPKNHNERGVPDELRKFVRKAYTLARQWGAGVMPEFPFNRKEAWFELVDRFDLRDDFADANGNWPDTIDDLVERGCNWTALLIMYGVKRCEDIHDFEDMIYVVLRLNLKMWQYVRVIVDECQDLNPIKRAQIRKMLAPGGRAIFVGDPYQAIMGFTGADSRSFANIKKEFGCTELPLTWSFRCAKAPVRKAQQWCPYIESAPDAPEGLDITMDLAEFWKQTFVPTGEFNDAIICRNNAPLVSVFFELLRRGIPAHIEGNDISRKLVDLVNRWPSIRKLNTLKDKIANYRESEVAKLTAIGKEAKADDLSDTCEAVLAVIDSMDVASSSAADLRKKISDMFEDTPEGEEAKTLTLTSSHKSKGREWHRVFWYGRNRWNPSPYARQDWQFEQEQFLMYVTCTRAKHTIVDVVVPVPSKKGRK